LKLKSGTIEMQIHPILTDFLFGLDEEYREHDSELIITSGSEPDPIHGYTSLHYALPGCAVDIRNWDLDGWNGMEQYDSAIEAATAYCNWHPALKDGDIDVVLESHHIHIELQPKRRSL
jgi:hypothetical protein